jgi:hypothetical protein
MRSGIADARLGPFENLATNPLFARAVAGSTIVRRNLVPSPNLTASAFRYVNAIGGSFTLPTANPSPRQLLDLGGPTGYARVDWGEAPTASPAALGAGSVAGGATGTAGRMPVTPGATYALSAFGAAGFKLGAGIRLDVNWYGVDHNLVASSGGAIVPNQPDEWMRVSRILTAPSSAVSVSFRLSFSGPQVGANSWIGAGGFLMERLPAVLPFFDGATLDDSGIAYSYEGAEGASVSLAKAAVVEVARNCIFNPMAVPGGDAAVFSAAGAPSSSGFATVDGYTAYQFTPTAAGDRMFAIATSARAPAGTYYPKVLVKASAGASFQVEHLTSNGSNPAAGVTRLNVTGTGSFQLVELPPVTVGASEGVRLGVRFAGGALDPIYGTRWSLATADVHIDGGSTVDADLTPGWAGAENASASALWGILADGVSYAANQAVAYLSWAAARSGLLGYRFRLAITGPIALPVSSVALEAGKVYTLLVRARANTRPVLVRPRIRSSDAGADPQTSLTPGTWVEFRYTAAAGSGSNTSQTGLVIPTSTSGHRIGDLIDIDDVCIIPGVYTGPFPNADRLNWRGPVNASAQVFYPRLSV